MSDVATEATKREASPSFAPAPTLADVEAMEEREEKLADEYREVQQRRARVSTSLAELIAKGEGDTEEAEELREERRDLLLQEEEMREAIPLLQQKITVTKDRALRAEAEDRLVGINRAAGSLTAELERDAERVAKAAEALEEAVERFNDRYEKIGHLRVEATALASRFGLDHDAPKLPVVDGAADALAGVQELHALTFTDVGRLHRHGPPSDSPGAKLIELAGPTREEIAEEAQEELERLEKEKKAREALSDPAVQRELARVEAWPKNVPMTGRNL